MAGNGKRQVTEMAGNSKMAGKGKARYRKRQVKEMAGNSKKAGNGNGM